MAKGIYIGVGGAVKKAKSLYVGVGGVPKKVKKAYVGVNGVPRLMWQSGIYTDTMTTVNISNTSIVNSMLLSPKVIRSIPLDDTRFFEIISAFPNGYSYIKQAYVRVVTYTNGTISYGPLFDLGYYHHGDTNNIDVTNLAYMIYFGCTDLVLKPNGNVVLVAGSYGVSPGIGYRDWVWYKEFSISGSTITLVQTDWFRVTGICGYSSVAFNPTTNRIYAVSAEDTTTAVDLAYVYIYAIGSGTNAPNYSINLFTSQYSDVYGSKFSFNKDRTRLIFARNTVANSSTCNKIELYSLSNVVSLITQITVSIPSTTYCLVPQYGEWSNEYMLLATTSGNGRVINYKNDVLSYSSSDTALGSFAIGHSMIKKLNDEDVFFDGRFGERNFIRVEGLTIQVLVVKSPTFPYYAYGNNEGIQLLDEIIWIYTNSTTATSTIVFYSMRSYFS